MRILVKASPENAMTDVQGTAHDKIADELTVPAVGVLINHWPISVRISSLRLQEQCTSSIGFLNASHNKPWCLMNALSRYLREQDRRGRSCSSPAK